MEIAVCASVGEELPRVRRMRVEFAPTRKAERESEVRKLRSQMQAMQSWLGRER